MSSARWRCSASRCAFARRQYALPVLVVAIAVLDQRAYYTSVVVPLALLAAIAVDEVVLSARHGS